MLIVDDDTPVRELMTVMASGEGYQTLEAQSGREAIELAEANHVDLVVTDLEMPEMTGTQLISTLQRRGLINRSLLVTGNTSALGAQVPVPWLAKPFTLGQFVEKIRVLLSD